MIIIGYRNFSNVGFVGLGNMGNSMAKNLLKKVSINFFSEIIFIRILETNKKKFPLLRVINLRFMTRTNRW